MILADRRGRHINRCCRFARLIGYDGGMKFALRQMFGAITLITFGVWLISRTLASDVVEQMARNENLASALWGCAGAAIGFGVTLPLRWPRQPLGAIVGALIGIIACGWHQWSFPRY